MKTDRISRIEEWRQDQGFSKADLARYFGVDNQTYNNWTYRNSLPKEYYDRADQILSGNVSATREGRKTILVTTPPLEVRERSWTYGDNKQKFDFNSLDEQELAEVMIAALSSLSPAGRKAILQALIDELL